MDKNPTVAACIQRAPSIGWLGLHGTDVRPAHGPSGPGRLVRPGHCPVRAVGVRRRRQTTRPDRRARLQFKRPNGRGCWECWWVGVCGRGACPRALPRSRRRSRRELVPGPRCELAAGPLAESPGGLRGRQPRAAQTGKPPRQQQLHQYRGDYGDRISVGRGP